MPSFWENIFGGAPDPRVEAAQKRMEEKHNLRMKMGEATMRLLEAERQNHILSEAGVNVGNPFWSEMSGLTIDEAWRRGLPSAEWSYGLSADDVAQDDAMRQLVRAQSRILYDQHPHAKGIIEGAVAYLVGGLGWQTEPTPRHPDPLEGTVVPLQESVEDPYHVQPFDQSTVAPFDDSTPPPRPAILSDDKPLPDSSPIDQRRAASYRAAWKRFIKRGKYHPQLGERQFQAEAVRRKLRDGEVFIYMGNNPNDGSLALRFLEPECIVPPLGTPTGLVGDVRKRKLGVFVENLNGVKVDKNDHSRVLGYWYAEDEATNPIFIPAEKVLHIKHGVDTGTRRGVPALFVVRHFLQHFDAWIRQSLRNQRIQSMVAIIRSWANTTQAAVQGMISAKTTSTVQRTTQSGNSLNYQKLDTLPILDAPAGMTQQMQAPTGNFADSEILVRRVMLAVAVGTNQSEAMVTGDGSNANYASTRITQLIPMRSIEAEQGDWAETWEIVYQKWVQTESAYERVPKAECDSHMDCNVTPSRLPNFEAEVAGSVASSLLQGGVVSRRTAQEMVRVDPEVENDRMDEEVEQMNAGNEQRLEDLFAPPEMSEEPEMDANLDDGDMPLNADADGDVDTEISYVEPVEESVNRNGNGRH